MEQGKGEGRAPASQMPEMLGTVEWVWGWEWAQTEQKHHLKGPELDGTREEGTKGGASSQMPG